MIEMEQEVFLVTRGLPVFLTIKCKFSVEYDQPRTSEENVSDLISLSEVSYSPNDWHQYLI